MAIQNKRIELNATEYIDYKHRKKDSLFDLLYGILRVLVIIVQNIYCVSSYLVLSWILLFPISWFSRNLYYKVENQQYNALMFIVSSWSLAGDMRIVETGDDFKKLIDFDDEQDINNEKNKSRKQSSNNNNTTMSHNDHSRALKSVSDNNGKSNPNNCNNINNITSKNEQSVNHGGDQGDCFRRECEDLRSNRNNKSNTNSINNGIKVNETCKINHVERSLRHNLYSANVEKTRKPRLLFLCNHISTADVPLLMQAFSTTKNLSIFWVLDAQFKATNFGLVCGSHGDFFIAKNTFTDGALTNQVLKFPDRNVLALFPEGGFWRKRLDGSNRYATKNGLPMTKYVTHPRFGAFKDLIDPHVGVTHIVDATLLYDNIRDPISILDIVLGTRNELALLDCKVYNINDINPNEEWLRGIWMEKDKLMQTFYDNREQFRRQIGKRLLRSARLDWVVAISIHIFYLLVCYLTVYRLFCSSNMTMLRAKTMYSVMHNKYHLFMNSEQY